MTVQVQQAGSVSPREVARCERDLLASASIEMGAHRPEDAALIANLLPAGTPVYVNHLPRHDLSDTMKALIAVHDAGLEPVPHLAARRVRSRSELRQFLERAVRSAGVSKVLVVGGDVPMAQGPYADGAALLRDGALSDCGLREVGLPAYPEGHPAIATPVLEAALQDKLALADAQGLSSYVVTQFSFAPARIVECCADLARRAPSVPVYVGLAGPTSPTALLRFAQRCGVSASLRALQAQGMGAVRLFTHTDPGEQLAALASHCVTGSIANVVGVHLYSFGGVAQTASWINGRITG